MGQLTLVTQAERKKTVFATDWPPIIAPVEPTGAPVIAGIVKLP